MYCIYIHIHVYIYICVCMYTYSICMLDDVYCTYILYMYIQGIIEHKSQNIQSQKSLFHQIESPTLDTKPPPESLSLS